MTDEIMIGGALDQPLSVDNDWYLNQIDEIANEALSRKDPHLIMDKLREIVMVMKMGGLVLAKGLYIVYHHWYEFDIEEDFVDMVFEYTGLHSHTIERYVKVWAMLENSVPEQYKEMLMQRNIKDLIPVAHAVDQGYELTNENWRTITQSPDYNTVAKIVREEIKHTTPRKGQLTLMLRRDGSILAYMDDEIKNIAWVDINDETELVRKAVNRLLDSAGVIRQ